MATIATRRERVAKNVYSFFTMKIHRLDAARIMEDMKMAGVRIEKVEYQKNGEAVVYFA